MPVSFKTVSSGGGILFADSKALQFIFKTEPSRLPYFDFALHNQFALSSTMCLYGNACGEKLRAALFAF